MKTTAHSLDTEIVVVSGLPRSGTSLMMQMLMEGGIAPLNDQVRTADVDNPRGYFEFEAVKRTKQDASWVPTARGKAVKMVSSLLYDLPADEAYRIVLMERDLDEVLDSQQIMLERLGRQAAPRDAMRQSYQVHLNRLLLWLSENVSMKVHQVNYNVLMADPAGEARRISKFLDGRVDVARMLGAIDTSLYRNRRSP